MKINSARFRGSCREYESCPDSWLPEFAFVGRSNVGKSSLINLLVDQKGLAKTSGVPGKTKLINFFEVNEAWSLVDLPGYGYAKVSRDQQAEFNIHVSAYLTRRENLKHVFLLVDSRLEPLDSDLAFVHWLDQCEVPFSIVFTKADKSSKDTVVNHSQLFLMRMEEYKISSTRTFSCSAKTKQGRGQLLEFIDSQLPKKSKKTTRVSLNWMNKR
ncbi:MAG: ribosome biogenesis GTP-binding protein YihA/YsxC [Verrucomicrobiota bacterium]